jgi:hypothetical protein
MNVQITLLHDPAGIKPIPLVPCFSLINSGEKMMKNIFSNDKHFAVF